MWDLDTVADAEYQNTKFLQGKSLPFEGNAVLQYWSVSTIETVVANVYMNVLR